MEEDKLINMRNELEFFINSMYKKPLHLIDISRLIQILKDAGIKIK